MSHMSQDSVYFSQLFESMNAVSSVDANILTSSDFQCFVPRALESRWSLQLCDRGQLTDSGTVASALSCLEHVEWLRSR